MVSFFRPSITTALKSGGFVTTALYLPLVMHALADLIIPTLFTCLATLTLLSSSPLTKAGLDIMRVRLTQFSRTVQFGLVSLSVILNLGLFATISLLGILQNLHPDGVRLAAAIPAMAFLPATVLLVSRPFLKNPRW
ncbi:hypothetical protein [Eilatimonas milleporae]|uniref:Uncharacterized protein n=1 Tax=Eilatimonas milleporae TaxID=911205 RepID=A0A3M0CJI2_9PROT|nr:hypothetical protein [Eilatimonas milleporae]RMB09035.1 hypothetical protein BXY39_1683 [Eilatimonas milleporae]